MKNVIEDETPPDMLDTVVKTLCTGPLTHSNILKNCKDSLYNKLLSHFNIEDDGTMKRIFDYTCVVSTRIETWIERFEHRYGKNCVKLRNLARGLTNNPELIDILCTPNLTAHSLRICHGKHIRSKYPEGADEIIKKHVQMFHDTAQEWCDIVEEFIQVCDNKAPMLYRCERVFF